LTDKSRKRMLEVEVDMELTKKTTILFPEDLYRRLVQLAHRRGVSMGELVRSACVRQYGLVSAEDRRQAVAELAELALPVGTAEEMAIESVPEPMSDLP
jgi:hypothetical protein